MAEKTTIPGLRIAAKAAGFRRAGRAWRTEPTDVPAADFDQAQIDALRAEPGLVVSDIEIDIEGLAPVAAVTTKPTGKKK